ncbi:MAG: TIGR04282 family arsenosugar biosynthesis glycosyltransferase [Gammaproteobacteria bacterium]|nr:TIGR04282 family arsenosugar biosynthesis glycosyltransferase [Gammaproteobacteria bacterium]MCW8973919.1 TIGR04282 family arsenosugar biosynthesis glycosyltransferase [Gammaproteobacteria bacterium]MCW8992781.1 TIGR04282 family arsenosugar biosynthesis glycosyltransferase [Gammaproteobacteria bacterium]
MSETDACALLVFARAPVPGEAKTRLIPALGAEGAAALQQRLLDDTLRMAADVAECELQLWCSPDTTHPAFVRIAEAYPLTRYRQRGKGLGERMAHALEQALAQSPFAIIIGTDCPELDANAIRECIDKLTSGCEAVIGPAADGGYYLLGLSRFEPSLFLGVDWGSDRVLAQTLERIEHLGMRYARLSLRHDLDRPEDLPRFPELH